MLTFPVIFPQGFNDHLEMFFIAKKVGIGSIYKKRFDIMLFDVMGIGFLDAEQVIVGDILLVGTVSFFDIGLEPVDRRMQVNKQVGLHQLLVDDIKKPLVKTEFIIGQRDFGKQQALGKKIIGNSEMLEHVLLLQQFF